MAAGAAAAPSPKPGVPDDSAQQLDLNLQALKEEALQIRADVQSTEQNLLYPDSSRVTLYFGVPVPGLLVQTISVSIDDAKPQVYQYDNLEAIALQTRGLQQLLKFNTTAGGHRVRAEITAKFASDPPNTAPFGSRLESSFTKDRAPANVELTLARDTVLARPTLKLREWVAEK